jgi:hypothetical protein
MSGRIMVGLIVIAAIAVAGSGNARRRQLNPIPFSHEPCSVLDNKPCTPSFCSVFNHGPCIPEIDYPYGENLQLTIESVPSAENAANYRKPERDLDTIGDLFADLRSCWLPPAPDEAREGMQMSVRFSFKKSGQIIAQPRITYATAGVPANVRSSYFKAITASLEACMPLKFTTGLAEAVAGRPISIRYVDNRHFSKKAGTP